MLVVVLTATVPVPVLVTALAGHMTWLSWAAVPTGVATGVVLVDYLGSGIERITRQRQQRVQHVTDRRAAPQE